MRWVNREEGAAAVSSGWAEAGLCVKPAAAEAQLGFISLQQEAYELCIAAGHLDDPRVRALLAVLQSSTNRPSLRLAA